MQFTISRNLNYILYNYNAPIAECFMLDAKVVKALGKVCWGLAGGNKKSPPTFLGGGAAFWDIYYSHPG